MAYVWNHHNPPQHPSHRRNQPATPYFSSIMFGTMPPESVAQFAAGHVHNVVVDSTIPTPPFSIFPMMSQQRYINQDQNSRSTHMYGVTRPRSNYDQILVGRGGLTNVNSEGLQPNSWGGNLMVSREDETLMMSFVLDESINQENPSPTDGLSEFIITRNLKTRECNLVRHDNDEDEICVVCQDGLCQANEKIGTLDCGHEYHENCIKKWLLQRNCCPICKATAISLD